jgi:type III secretory pathway lipoprotein EscJ
MNTQYKSCKSSYELTHIKWVGIEYDKEKLIEFVTLYENLKSPFSSKLEKEELKVMEDILATHNISSLEKLLNNDKDYSRWATIEKWARIASVEILLNQRYSNKTFTVISNLPILDYKLVVKRCKELVKIISDITAEAEADTSKIPGVK